MGSEVTECENINDEQTHKKGRHRKKQLYNSILQQMEFYFSDSNLTKDRFLSQLLKENPYVDLNVFLKFNKLRKLTTNIEDIRKALKNSKLIQLSEDKNSICRKEPIKEKTNVEECTIYVERLKSDATHEWLTSVFSEFGNVVYVSIPKYKHNSAIKGFAFVEFDNEREAQNALNYFESIGCKMPSNAEPEQLCSIVTFESKNGEEQNDSDSKSKKSTNNSEELNDSGSQSKKKKDDEVSEEKDNDSQLKKRSNNDEDQNDSDSKSKKRTNSEELNDSGSQSKKRKVYEVSEEKDNDSQLKKRSNNGEEQNDSGSQLKKRKVDEVSEEKENASQLKKRKVDEVSEEKDNEDKVKKPRIETGEVSETEDAENKKKKKLKKEHKKKNYIKELGLQVLSKKEWKKMRNRYLDLQKKKMKEFKKHLHKAKFSQANYEDKFKKPNENGEHKKPVEENPSKIEFVKGVIVKMKLTDSSVDVKKFKNEIKASSNDVKYVDIPNPGSEDIYIRFGSNKSASNFCSQESGKRTILEGEEEKAYWDKLLKNREDKFQKGKKKQRGRDKLLKKANKRTASHIKFDD